MPVLVVEVRSNIVSEDLEAPLSEVELSAIEAAVATVRSGDFGTTTTPDAEGEPIPAPSVRFYRRGE